jgi:peptidoglycan/LPS O-acetylase OafA/YrhL
MVVSHDLVAGFYSPLTRFWELMMGSLLAGLALSRPLPTHGANARAVAGAALLLAALLALDERSRFPGWWALLPTIGTTLIISAGAQAWVNRALLSNRVLV